MQSLEFTAEELEVLREVLQRGVTEIDAEVFRTDTHEFKAILKHRREVLEKILTRISTLPMAA